jgi:hypothetical protein
MQWTAVPFFVVTCSCSYAALPISPLPPPLPHSQEACCPTTNTCFDKSGGCGAFAARCPPPDCGKDTKFESAECAPDVSGRQWGGAGEGAAGLPVARLSWQLGKGSAGSSH